MTPTQFVLYRKKAKTKENYTLDVLVPITSGSKIIAKTIRKKYKHIIRSKMLETKLYVLDMHII